VCLAYGDTPTKNAILMTIAGVWYAVCAVVVAVVCLCDVCVRVYSGPVAVDLHMVGLGKHCRFPTCWYLPFFIPATWLMTAPLPMIVWSGQGSWEL